MSEVEVNIDEEAVFRRMRLGVVNGMLDTQLVIGKLVRSNLSKPGGGRRYRISRGRANGRNLRAQGIHVASAAGQPPAVSTGRLRQSWSLAGDASRTFGRKGNKTSQTLASVEVEDTRDRIGFSYGSNLKYARWLEFGTRRMRQRPYVRPVFQAVAKRVERIIGRAVEEAMKQP